MDPFDNRSKPLLADEYACTIRLKYSTYPLDFGYYMCGPTMTVLISIGLVSNLIFLLVLSKSARPMPTVNFYTIPMCLCDFCVLTGSFFMVNLSHLLYGRMKSYGPYVRFYPILTYFSNFAYTCCVWLIICLSIERYFAVCHPLTHRIYDARRRSITISSTCVLASLLFNIPRYFESTWHECMDQTSGSIVPLAAETAMRVSRTYWIAYKLTFGTLLLSIGPLVALCVLSVLMWKPVKESGAFLRGSSRKASRENRQSRNGPAEAKANDRRQQQPKRPVYLGPCKSESWALLNNNHRRSPMVDGDLPSYVVSPGFYRRVIGARLSGGLSPINGAVSKSPDVESVNSIDLVIVSPSSPAADVLGVPSVSPAVSTSPTGSLFPPPSPVMLRTPTTTSSGGSNTAVAAGLHRFPSAPAYTRGISSTTRSVRSQTGTSRQSSRTTPHGGHDKQNRTLLYTLFCIVLKFTLCHTLPAIIDLCETLMDPEVFHSARMDNLVDVSTLLVVANSSLNFFIHLWCSRQFRRKVKSILISRQKSSSGSTRRTNESYA